MGQIIIDKDILIGLMASSGQAMAYEIGQGDPGLRDRIESVQNGILHAFDYLTDKEGIRERELFGAASYILDSTITSYRDVRPKVSGREFSVPNFEELSTFMSSLIFTIENSNISNDKKLEAILGGIPFAQPMYDGNKRLSRVVEGAFCLKYGLKPVIFNSRDEYVDLLFDYGEKQDSLAKQNSGEYFIDRNSESDLLTYIRKAHSH